MREIVYLSESMLRQFIPKRKPWGGLTALRITSPVGGVDFEQRQDQTPWPPKELKQVLRHLRNVASDLRTLVPRAGTWISFEVPLVYAIKDDVVLFRAASSNPYSSYEQVPTSLLLHGSARNLVMERPPGQVNEHNLYPHGYLQWSRALDALAEVENAAPPASFSGVDPNPGSPWDSVVQLAKPGPLVEAATMMRGYAMLSITSNLAGYGYNTVVVASPLIIELAR